jgi:hypothetical protein
MKAPMTKKNLSRYYEMKQEYKKQEKTLEEIQDFLSQCQECESHNCEQRRGLELYQKGLEKLVELTAVVCDYEKKHLQSQIDKVPDCRMHWILALRYIGGLSWNQVAATVHEGLAGNQVRKLHNYYLSDLC